MFNLFFNLNNHLNEFPEIVQYAVIMLELNGLTDSLERLSTSLKIVWPRSQNFLNCFEIYKIKF